jgi:tRNA nucleotidyltransferase/poly(A) polymerase
MQVQPAELKSIFNQHPHFSVVSQVYHKLRAAGYEVFLAGGCVRDALLNVLPKDFDLATSATPAEVIPLFAKTIDIGKAFGVVMVIEQGVQVEVTTFRQDGLYVDGRRPSTITFSSAQEDAKRRDFTVNALFYDLESEKWIDYVDGLRDLKAGVLRAVGDANLRFQEDSLRMLRAVRFVSQLGFSIEPVTRQAICHDAEKVVLVSQERIHAEMEKLLISRHRKKALQELIQTQLAAKIFPAPHWSIENVELWFDGVNEEVSAVKGWILFWNLYLQGIANLDERSFFSVLDQFRFSSAHKATVKQALRFRFKPENFSEKSLGELVDQGFDPTQAFAMNLYAEKNIISQDKWSQVRQLLLRWAHQKPVPLVRAQDLSGVLSPGPELGVALRICYWAQLEGRLQNLTDAVNYLKQQKVLK